MKFLNTLSLTMALMTSLTGCATLMHGSMQSVGISSNPSNASVWVDKAYAGQTPMIAQLSRKKDHVVRIELEGYYPYEAAFSRKLSHWVFGNVVFGGIIGLAIDAVTGSIYMLTPDQIQAELRANNICYSKRSQDSFIAVVLEPDPSWKKIGNLEAIPTN
ncbi:MAG: hypothetical protein Tsb0021_08170 [Chlamydiales bacterium]